MGSMTCVHKRHGKSKKTLDSSIAQLTRISDYVLPRTAGGINKAVSRLAGFPGKGDKGAPSKEPHIIATSK